MEIEISDTKEMSDNLLSLDGIDLEETGTGKCLTLEGITNENETAEELKKYSDNGEFELNIEDARNQLDIKIDDDINKTNLNEGDDFGVKNSDVLHNVTDKEDKNKHLYEVDNKVPATETPSVQNLNSEIVEEAEKNNVITEQEDLIHSNSNNSNDVQDTVQLDITDTNKDQKHEEDEHEEVSLENILQKTKNDQSDSSDSEFDFDLPEKSKEPQRHIKSSETSVPPPKTVVSVSDIDFAFSSAPPIDEQNVKKNSNEFKIEHESDKKKSDLINSVRKDTTDESDEITKFTKVIEEEGQGQESSNVTSPQKKRAPDIPPTTLITQDKTDSKVDSNRVEINDDKKVMAANGNVATETEEQETVTTNAALRHAMDEWDNVQTIEAGFSDSKSGAQGSVPKIVQAMPLLSFHEMYDHFKTCDFSSVKPNIQTHIERHGFAAFKNFLFGPPKLHRDLLSDRENVFCVAGSSLDNTNNIHLRSLQTIYRTLTGSRFDCGRYGNHWEEIGFQGNDPSTDLRGAGMLGLANLIHFLSDPRKKPLAQDIYKLSLHPTQNFPFCVVGINISRITLQSLREDLLNKECNKRKDVFEVVNDFYVGLYLQLYQVWKFQGKTIADSGNVIKHIETTAKKSPHHVFKKLEEYLSKKKTGKSTSAVDLESMDIGNDNFLGVCETEAGQY